MTSCVAIAQLRPGRKIFNRQHLQELALSRGRGAGQQRKTAREGQPADRSSRRRQKKSLTLEDP